MVDINTVRRLATAFDAVEELPHFEKTSFRVKKKIFATLDESNLQVVLKLSEIHQSVFCAFDTTIVYPVSGAWGKKGWTVVELEKVQEDLFIDALTLAYCEVAPRLLANRYRQEEGDAH